MSGDLVAQLRDELGKVPQVRRQLGVFVEQRGNLAVVTVGDERIAVPMSGFQPAPGSPVWLETQHGRTICTGASQQFSPYGTALTSTTDLVKVLVDDGPEVELPYRKGATLRAGDRVEINWLTRVVQGALSVTPERPVDPGGGGSAAKPFSGLLVQSTQSGSTNGAGWWQDAVNCDSNAGGGWFYGSRGRDALRGVQSISRVEVFLPSVYSHFGAPPIRLHTAGSKPGSGFPPFGASFQLSGVSGWRDLPAGWGSVLQAGGGLGFAPVGGVYASWRGRGSDAMSGALRFSGTR